MNKVNPGDTTNRNALLKWCLAEGMSIEDIEKITRPMHGKSNEEKEQIAEQIISDIILQELRKIDKQLKEMADDLDKMADDTQDLVDDMHDLIDTLDNLV